MSQSGYSGRDNRSVEYCWHSDFTIGTVAYTIFNIIVFDQPASSEATASIVADGLTKLLSRHKHESFLRMLRMVDVGYLIA